MTEVRVQENRDERERQEIHRQQEIGNRQMKFMKKVTAVRKDKRKIVDRRERLGLGYQ